MSSNLRPYQFNRYKYGNNNPYKYKDPDGQKEVNALLKELEVIAKSLFFDGSADANANGPRVLTQDVPQYAKASFKKNALLTAEVATGLATKAAKEGLGPAATVAGFIPGGQGIAAALTVADLAINGGISEAVGALSGKGGELLANDALTDSGRRAGNWKTAVLTAAIGEGAKQLATDTIKPHEEQVTNSNE